MTTHSLRLRPGQDLKRELDRLAVERNWSAAFLLTGIGSLTSAAIRFADAEAVEILEGPWEILSLAGTLSPDGSHVHVLVADAQGLPRGGHLKEGATIRTTAEIVIGVLSDEEFAREQDLETGCAELVIRRREPKQGNPSGASTR